jgi:hypothetical protein
MLPACRVENIEVLHDLIEQVGFAKLATLGSGGQRTISLFNRKED